MIDRSEQYREGKGEKNPGRGSEIEPETACIQQPEAGSCSHLLDLTSIGEVNRIEAEAAVQARAKKCRGVGRSR